MLKQRLEQDLKSALLAGDKQRVTVLRGLKTAILYAEVEKGVRDSGLEDAEIITLFSKEVKKRQESADLYVSGGSGERAAAELAEKAIIEEYLPKPLSDEELIQIIDKAIADLGVGGPQAMGQVISAVKKQTAGAADGAKIAQLVKERL